MTALRRTSYLTAYDLQRTRDEDTMKAIVQDRYGSADVLELKDIDPPVITADEVLVEVR